MDIYDISFIFSTLWVGPFWFAMLFTPFKDSTSKLLEGPWFFLGPLIIWYLVSFMSPPDISLSSDNGSDILENLAKGMATKEGLTAIWAHMVAGDIFVTKWIWKKCIESKTNIWIMRFSIFFGVMLMPIGLAAYVIFGSKKELKN